MEHVIQKDIGRMNVYDDLFKDQMCTHSSMHWTKGTLELFHQSLISNGWNNLTNNNYDYGSYIKNQKTLIVNLTHMSQPDSCDYYIGDAVTPWQDFKLYPEVFGVYAHEFNYREKQPSKLFNCFIKRGCSFRQGWFYFLVKNNLLDQGHVSFWCEDRFKNTDPREYSEYIFQMHNREMFATEHEQMRDKIPYKNFDISIEDAIIDSAKSLVIETFFEPNDYICYTEKTWRAIQMPRPLLLFSSQYAVKYLREWGFDMFDDFVDHSYDTEPDKFVRQQMILNELVKNIEYRPELFEQRAQHNRNLLKKYQQQWPQTCKNTLDTIVKISNNESLT